jgi:probable F420-dependent oxidoreductase
MQFGIAVPNFRGAASPETFWRVAEVAEAATVFEALWVGDHVVLPERTVSFHPYSGGTADHLVEPMEFHQASGRMDLRPTDPVYDPLVVLSALGAVTRRIRLGVGVLIIPYRNPVLTAKMLATLDVMTGGRVIMGAGVGWLREEFEALGTPFEARGTVTDEYLDIIRAAWTADEPAYEGRHYRLPPGIRFFPRPIQKPQIPIWLGGNTPPAFRRTARIGDGWLGVYQGFEDVARSHRALSACLAAQGRDPAEVVRGQRVRFEVTPSPEISEPCVGPARKVIDDIRRYQDLGVQHLQLATPTGPREVILDQIRRFTDDIWPRLSS